MPESNGRWPFPWQLPQHSHSEWADAPHVSQQSQPRLAPHTEQSSPDAEPVAAVNPAPAPPFSDGVGDSTPGWSLDVIVGAGSLSLFVIQPEHALRESRHGLTAVGFIYLDSDSAQPKVFGGA